MAIIIRGEQMRKFEEKAGESFENEMVAHFRGYAPELSRIAGDAGVRAVVKIGLERAQGYGFTNRGPARFFLECMFSLGSSFDSDPQLPWAEQILNDSSLRDQAERADKLFRAQEQYFDVAAGPGQRYAVQALRRVQQTSPAAFHQAQGEFDSRVIGGIATIYPEKAAYVGNEALRALAARGRGISEEIGITSEAGIFLIIGMMYGFGHGVVWDPLYPWVGGTLFDDRQPDPNERAKRLYQKMKLYVDRMIQNLG